MDIRWIKIPGRPRSAQGRFKDDYRRLIGDLARPEFSKPWDGDLTVVLLFVYENRPGSNPDLDNSAKLILDALKGIAYHDDEQVCPCRLERFHLGKPVVTSAPVLPPGDALQRAAEIKREECVFVGIVSPRF